MRPHCMRIGWEDLGPSHRMDFGYHHSCRWLQKLVAAHPHLGWRHLNELIEIQRGPRKSPRGPRVSLHTTDHSSGVWKVHTRHLRAAAHACIAPTDLFVARVGRACLATLGPVAGYRSVSWSDCVFRLRAKGEAISSMPLLLSLRSVCGMPAASQLVEQGVGATYITESGLGQILVPTKLSSAFPRWTAAYAKAARKGDARRMRRIEQRVRSHLIRQIGPLE
jgi:hypothetical protein